MKTRGKTKSLALSVLAAISINGHVNAGTMNPTGRGVDEFDLPEVVSRSREETIGTSTGIVVGGLLAGPPGIIIGGITGNYFGRKTHDSRQLGKAKDEITRLRAELKRNRQLACARTASTGEGNKLLASTQPVSLTAGIDSLRLIRDGFSMYVQFRTDSASVEPHYQARLGVLATSLKKLPTLTINIQGYADQRGSDSYNMRLSSRRVTAVYDALVKAGISPSRIKRYAYGEGKPLSKAKDPDSLNFERRVVISFSSREGSK